MGFDLVVTNWAQEVETDNKQGNEKYYLFALKNALEEIFINQCSQIFIADLRNIYMEYIARQFQFNGNKTTQFLCE